MEFQNIGNLKNNYAQQEVLCECGLTEEQSAENQY